MPCSYLSKREKGRDPKSNRALPPQSKFFRINYFTPFINKHRKELRAVLQSYYDANKIQCLLKPYMANLFRSKLACEVRRKELCLGR